ncbi:hypothetical protein BX667DRAFT_495745 [Coemansia mojavensis]|nr:hypothetical protein BX667DRAFT_495745 [Coemansia mojavensis]
MYVCTVANKLPAPCLGLALSLLSLMQAALICPPLFFTISQLEWPTKNNRFFTHWSRAIILGLDYLSTSQFYAQNPHFTSTLMQRASEQSCVCKKVVSTCAMHQG